MPLIDNLNIKNCLVKEIENDKTYSELNEIDIIKLILNNSDFKDDIHIKNRINTIIYKMNNIIINQFN